MLILGINETSHDASLSLIKNGNILFAGHSERYSKEKNDWYINKSLIDDVLSYGKPDIAAYYEKPFLKKSRLLLGGGYGEWKPKFIPGVPIKKFKHHHSHAAAGYFTSKFNDAVVVVLDSIGEWTTSSVWLGKDNDLKRIKSYHYPFSFGLFYSAFTKLIGLKPNEEEYIMMGMAAYGDPYKYYSKINSYFSSINNQSYNFHKGISDWNLEITDQDRFDIAASAQMIYQKRLIDFMKMVKEDTKKNNLVFMGGCALNCSANTALWEIFSNIWIMPNPGDSGSSLGAAAALYGKHINWKTPYLGHDLKNEYLCDDIVNGLIKDKVVAVASGRAEFGPRAFGNRSILADPRDPKIKDKVNMIKQRQPFRPFAPVIMEEYARDWFDMDFISPYMQYAVKAKFPEKIPSVVHFDGTSRVQTVNAKQHSGLYEVLSKWNKITGIPILLNTSLNIKGQPLLNDKNDIIDWESNYGVKIYA